MTARLGVALVLVNVAACSLVINPDESRLSPDANGVQSDGPTIEPNDDAADEGVIVIDDVTPPPDDVETTDEGDASTHDPDGAACPMSCDDGVACTADSCDAANRTCMHAPDDTRCGPAMRCDGVRGCVPLVPAGCMRDAQCDDNNVCNGIEHCVSGACAPGAAMHCDDGNACNGAEQCDPRRGCAPGAPMDCSDGNDCTSDRCVAPAGTCTHAPIDGDNDGFTAAFVGNTVCATGNDCDDTRGSTHVGAAETCNGRDDNCNGAIDDGLSCGILNDTCDTADVVQLGLGFDSVTASGTTAGAGSGVEPVCGRRDGAGDVWYAVTWPAASDLRLETVPGSATSDTVLDVRTACDSADLACNDDDQNAGRASRLWVRGRPGAPGRRTIQVVVDAYQQSSEGPFTLRASILPAAAGGCAAPFDLSAGGTVLAVAPATGSTTGTCGGATGGEDVYALSGPAGNYSVTAGLLSGRQAIALYGHTATCASGRETFCVTGNPARVNNGTFSGTPGFIFVDALPTDGSQYSIQLVRP